MQIQAQHTPAPQPPNKRKIGLQEYPANPDLDKWAETAEYPTVPKFWRMAVEKNPDGPYVGDKVGKEYEFRTYRQVAEQAETFSSGLISLGIQPTDRVAVFGENSGDWRVADFGVANTAAVLTCLLADYKDERAAFVLKDSGSKAIMVDNQERLEQILRVEGELPELQTIIVGADGLDLSQFKSTKKLMSLDSLMELGKASFETNKPEMEKRIEELRYDDIGSIVYTSGSTGNPKGVLLSHGNVLAAVEGDLKAVNNNPEETLKSARRDDVYPSILPQGHVMGRVADYVLTAEGAQIFYPGNLTNFAKDLKDIKPTVLAVTPLFLHKIFDNVENKAVTKTDTPAIPPFIAGLAAGTAGAALGGTTGALIGAGIGGAALPWGLGIAGAIIGGVAADRFAQNLAENTSQAELFLGSLKNSKEFYEAQGDHKVSTRIKHELAQKFVFSKVKDQIDQRLGGNVRLVLSGGAPLSGEAESLMRAAGYGIAQGYGLAETSSGALMNTPEIAALGTGGAALPGLEARLGEGNEIQIKGPTVMTGGYLNRDDKTKESFTDDGWYRTGDTGKVVKTKLPISMARVAGYTAAGTGLGAAVGALIGHPAVGAALGAVASSTATVLSGIARPEGKDHYIISGRIKSQFKLPGGEYVTPEPIEAALQGSPFIARALVAGGKERDLVGALIQPNFEALNKWCADKGITGTPEELVKNPEVIKLFESEAQTASSTFNKHEVVRRVALLPKELTGDEVTNKGEVMRSIVAERYAAQIVEMFA